MSRFHVDEMYKKKNTSTATAQLYQL